MTDAASRPIAFRAWEGADTFRTGATGLALDAAERAVIADSAETTEFTDPHTGTTRHYDVGSWTSAPWQPGFAATEVIPSWNAITPPGTWVEVAVRAAATTPSTAGAAAGWYVLARWCSGDGPDDIRRSSLTGQDDARATVRTDVLRARGDGGFTDLQVRIRLFRLAGTSATPALSLVAACATALPATPAVPVSSRTGAGEVLDVPAYSQMVHTGHYPEWNGGGEAWCSPTSTAMVLDHFGLGPEPSETAWVDLAYEDRPQVDHAARATFDHSFGGTGNWTFNTAYAGTRGARAYVTRLRSLAEAEHFIRAGIPLVCSVSFTRDQLDGADYDTKGHLLVLVGVDEQGDVVVNDPASHDRSDDAAVLVTYRREQFENVWIPRSGGTVYVITPPGHPLPEVAESRPANWG